MRERIVHTVQHAPCQASHLQCFLGPVGRQSCVGVYTTSCVEVHVSVAPSHNLWDEGLILAGWGIVQDDGAGGRVRTAAGARPA